MGDRLKSGGLWANEKAFRGGRASCFFGFSGVTVDCSSGSGDDLDFDDCVHVSYSWKMGDSSKCVD